MGPVCADGYHGWLAYDIGDPATPRFLGGFVHPSTGYTHTIQAGMIAGRRIVATVEEVGANLLKVYDATNLMQPVLLGVWHTDSTLGPVNSQHNLQIVKKHLYLAHYRQGIYVFDLAKVARDATPITSTIEPVALYRPEGARFWDVVLEAGLLYAGKFDAGGGFDVVGFGCITPGVRAFSTPAETRAGIALGGDAIWTRPRSAAFVQHRVEAHVHGAGGRRLRAPAARVAFNVPIAAIVSGSG